MPRWDNCTLVKLPLCTPPPPCTAAVGWHKPIVCHGESLSTLEKYFVTLNLKGLICILIVL